MREKIVCDTQFRISCSGCVLVSDENGTCVVRDCRKCDVAIGYVRRRNLVDRENGIPSIRKTYMGVEYLSNLDGTIGLMSSMYDALCAFPYDYRPTGYSAYIMKLYPLLSILRTSLHLPIPKNMLWYNNHTPLIIEYNDTHIYAISPKHTIEK